MSARNVNGLPPCTSCAARADGGQRSIVHPRSIILSEFVIAARHRSPTLVGRLGASPVKRNLRTRILMGKYLSFDQRSSPVLIAAVFFFFPTRWLIQRGKALAWWGHTCRPHVITGVSSFPSHTTSHPLLIACIPQTGTLYRCLTVLTTMAPPWKMPILANARPSLTH